MATRQSILEAIVARLQAIQIPAVPVANGFETNAGSTVFLGETPSLGPDDPDAAVAVVVGDDQPVFQGSGFLITLPITIYAVTKADLDAPYLAAETILADIKRAMELEDRKLGGRLKWHGLERGATRTMRRDEGSTTVGVGVDYVMQYQENWGNP